MLLHFGNSYIAVPPCWHTLSPSADEHFVLALHHSSSAHSMASEWKEQRVSNEVASKWKDKGILIKWPESRKYKEFLIKWPVGEVQGISNKVASELPQ